VEDTTVSAEFVRRCALELRGFLSLSFRLVLLKARKMNILEAKDTIETEAESDSLEHDPWVALSDYFESIEAPLCQAPSPPNCGPDIHNVLEFRATIHWDIPSAILDVHQLMNT
jgi:hypothetical protein